MIPSGIAPLDERLGGLIEQRPYVLTGGPGTGKTVACLAFLNAAFATGEQALMITEDYAGDLFAEGRYLGIDIEHRIAEGRLALLRFERGFADRVARESSPGPVFDEVRKLMGGVAPRRVVIDSVAPFVSADDTSGRLLEALAQFIESLGATAMVSCPDNLDVVGDARLRPLVSRAEAVLALSRNADGEQCLEIRQVRHAVPSTEPISFVIGAGAGIVRAVARKRRRPENAPRREREVAVTQHVLADGRRPDPLTEHDFRNAVQEHMAGDAAPAFTVVTLRPTDGSVPELGEVVLGRLRIRDGDLAGQLDDGVAVYLHSTRRRDLDAFIARVRHEWVRRGHGELRTDSASYPSDGDRLATVLDSASAEASDEVR